MKITNVVLLAVVCILVSGCTENQRARQLGGNMHIKLPECEKLVNATWKQQSDLWYLTRQFRAGESAETSMFVEDSNFGVLNGTVTFIEHCPSGKTPTEH
jgi:hypothetical protein